jgi:hypothetical protein
MLTCAHSPHAITRVSCVSELAWMHACMGACMHACMHAWARCFVVNASTLFVAFFFCLWQTVLLIELTSSPASMRGRHVANDDFPTRAAVVMKSALSSCRLASAGPLKRAFFGRLTTKGGSVHHLASVSTTALSIPYLYSFKLPPLALLQVKRARRTVPCVRARHTTRGSAQSASV